MIHRYIVRGALVASALALCSVSFGPLLAAGPQDAPPKPAAPPPGPAKRLANGVPDISGTWRKVGAGTEEKGIVYEAVSVNNENPYPQLFIDPKTGVAGFKVNPRQELFTKDVLQEGIVELGADGRLPWQEWAWKERVAKQKKFQDPEGLADVQPIARCMVPSVNMHGSPKIVQTPNKILLIYEGYHAFRTIQLENQPHAGAPIRLFAGNSRGHWEGDTLVVHSTNFTGQTWHDMSGLFESDAMQVTERYTVTNADMMTYEVTIDDPKLFTKQWKTAGHFERDPKDSEFVEDSCVEGQVIGHQLESVLYKLGRGRITSRPESSPQQ